MADRRQTDGCSTARGVSPPSIPRRILVVSACSKRKAPNVSSQASMRPDLSARVRYTGRAHVRIREAVDRWRLKMCGDLVEWSIISAGLGCVSEHSPVPVYDASFTGLGPTAARKRGRDLGLPCALRKQLALFDLAIFVLPLAYLHASGAPFECLTKQLYFASPAFRSPGDGYEFVPSGAREARQLGVTSREIGAVRFASFVEDVISNGLRAALIAWRSQDRAA